MKAHAIAAFRVCEHSNRTDRLGRRKNHHAGFIQPVNHRLATGFARVLGQIGAGIEINQVTTQKMLSIFKQIHDLRPEGHLIQTRHRCWTDRIRRSVGDQFCRFVLHHLRHAVCDDSTHKKRKH